MLDVENKVVRFGDKDLKIGFNLIGMLIGTTDMPNEGELFEQYSFGIIFGIEEAYYMLEHLKAVYDGNAESFEFGEHKFVFTKKDDAVSLANAINDWVSLVIEAYRKVEDEYISWLEEENGK